MKDLLTALLPAPLVADRPAKVSGRHIGDPTVTEKLGDWLVAIGTQVKGSPGQLFGDIHSACTVGKKEASLAKPPMFPAQEQF
jgi:hypothetical protein